MDYAYTLQGWMKTMNSDNLNPQHDMGMDGCIDPAGPDAIFARDAFGYSLGYFSGDYVAISGPNSIEILKFSSIFENDSRDLFNGNIKQMTVGIMDMDDLRYSYASGTNRLTRVQDAVSGGYYPEDIDDQPANNYGYDPTGNLVKDSLAGQRMEWTVYGKLKRVITNSYKNLSFEYDATGNRVKKTLNNADGTKYISTYYIRDAQGNIMSVYQRKGDTFWLTEQHLYGSSRLGVRYCKMAMNHDIYDTVRLTDSLGMRQYELTNHLGNVQVTITDRKIPVHDDFFILYFDPDVVAAYDYYPFGMLMPGRIYNLNYVDSNQIYTPGNRNYPFGFNNKEKVNELYGEGNGYDFGARMYDPRIGRWWGVDLLFDKYPEYSPYIFSANSIIVLKDVDGKDFRYTVDMEKPTPIITVSSTIHVFGNDANNFNTNSINQSRITQFTYYDAKLKKNVTKNVIVQIKVDFVIEKSEEQAKANMKPGDNLIKYDLNMDGCEINDFGGGYDGDPSSDNILDLALRGGPRANLRSNNIIDRDHTAFHLLGFKDRYQTLGSTLANMINRFSTSVMSGPLANTSNLAQDNIFDLANNILKQTGAKSTSKANTLAVPENQVYEGPLNETQDGVTPNFLNRVN